MLKEILKKMEKPAGGPLTSGELSQCVNDKKVIAILAAAGHKAAVMLEISKIYMTGGCNSDHIRAMQELIPQMRLIGEILGNFYRIPDILKMGAIQGEKKEES